MHSACGTQAAENVKLQPGKSYGSGGCRRASTRRLRQRLPTMRLWSSAVCSCPSGTRRPSSWTSPAISGRTWAAVVASASRLAVAAAAAVRLEGQMAGDGRRPDMGVYASLCRQWPAARRAPDLPQPDRCSCCSPWRRGSRFRPRAA